LVPKNDPTLLFTNSGMVQFKDCFTGVQNLSNIDTKLNPTQKTAVSVQKCVRAGGKHNDLDNVGHTNRHHTFFEMLGNFSFGGYFKEGAIYNAYNFLVKTLGLPLERLYFTVYHNDVEAFNLWKKIAGVSDDKIIKISTNDNFWQMGPVGPCGPCSEIFYDYGDKIQGDKPGTAGQDGPRFTEIWNLVFMQYERFYASGECKDECVSDGSEGEKIYQKPLTMQCIDTGMGLERLVSVLEGKTDNYETSLFAEIINFTNDVFLSEGGIKNFSGDVKQSPYYLFYRITADHIRSSVFMIADGILPSNEGRGYVLRRIIRRALRHYFMNGGRAGFFVPIAQKVIELMGSSYPELNQARAVILTALANEEQAFLGLLPEGLKMLEKASEGKKMLEGEIAFKLYDTYGFPLDITEDILAQKNIKLDKEGFETAMSQQKTRSKASWTGSGEAKNDDILLEISRKHKTEFVGYNTTQCEAKVVDCKQLAEDIYIIITNKTPFYPEGGGQVGEIGFIENVEVVDTKKIGETIFHYTQNAIEIGKNIMLAVNVKHRAESGANHTATHLLHHALHLRFGKGVVQKGSLVEPARLRFDFSYNKPLTSEDIEFLESTINGWIVSDAALQISRESKDAAVASGVMALFGEKYEDEVRVVRVVIESSKCASMELCGGLHVKALGEIGLFKIVSECGIGGGIRRLEAKTGMQALNHINAELGKFYGAMVEHKIQNTAENEISKAIAKLKSENQALKAELGRFKALILSQISPVQMGGYLLVCVNQAQFSSKELMEIINKNYNSLTQPIVFEHVDGSQKSCFCKSAKGLEPADAVLKQYNSSLQNIKGSAMFAVG